MIALALLAAIASTPVPADDIVISAKLRKIRLSADSDDAGRITACRVTVSSGDKLLDDQACEATRSCAESGVASAAISDCVDGQMIAFVTAQAANFQEKRN